MKPGKMHAPRDIREILVLLSWVLLKSPQFIEKSGYFQWMRVTTYLVDLKEGLGNVRETLGEERYQELMRMSDRMQAHFQHRPRK